MTQQTYDVVVVGEGISGLTAANLVASHGLAVATLESKLFGGLVLNVNELKPGPDDRELSGAEFAAGLMEANAELGVTSIQEAVTQIRSSDNFVDVVTASGSYRAQHVILASGARIKKLGVPGEAEFEGRGVSQCADCDGPIFHNQDVVVVGGGDSALQEALVLSQFCKKIYLIHRGQQFRARPEFVEAVAANSKISVVRNAQLESISGGKVVENAQIKYADGRLERTSCAAVFAYIGLVSNADYVPVEVTRDADGFIVTDNTFATALHRVWAIGALRSGYSGVLPAAIAEAKHVAEIVATQLSTRSNFAEAK